MGLKLTNNAVSRLSAGITASSTSISLVPGEGLLFPTLAAGDYFPATLVKTDGSIEIVKVTARSTDTLTVVRAQEGTTAKSFLAGDRIELRLTAAVIDEINNYPPSKTGAGASGTWGINVTGSAGSVAWGNVAGRPTAVSSFTNDSGYITSSGRAYPRRSDGGDLNFHWSGQTGQPTWLWGGNDGNNMYVYNPSNFNVSYANSSGSCSGNAATATKLTNDSGYAPSYSCRAWVNFNGTGTVAIRASGNVSSITDNATGDYTVNFTTAMPDTNYSAVGSASVAAGWSSNIYPLAMSSAQSGYTAQTTSSVRMAQRNSGNSHYDAPYITVAIFR